MRIVPRLALFVALLIGGCDFPRETRMEPIVPAATQPPPRPPRDATSKKPQPTADRS